MGVFAPPGVGSLVQVVSTLSSGTASGTTTIPLDDTIPQITEGNEFMTLAITPKSTTNLLIIDAELFVSHSAVARMIGALFQDATANALAATSVYQGTAGGEVKLFIRYTMTAGTTSSTTFRLRAGSNTAGTIYFNGFSTGRTLGATTKSSMVIYEIKA